VLLAQGQETCLFFFFFFPFSFLRQGLCYVAQASLELEIFLPLPPLSAGITDVHLHAHHMLVFFFK
jgi:hypothetical protein